MCYRAHTVFRIQEEIGTRSQLIRVKGLSITQPGSDGAQTEVSLLPIFEGSAGILPFFIEERWGSDGGDAM